MPENNKPEREKGAAPADYMPAIFGWLSMEDQAEQAQEISDISKNLKHSSENISNFKFTRLSNDQLNKIQDLEEDINSSNADYIYLIAFNKK